MQTSYFKLIALILICTYSLGHAQIERVEPPNWWVGMENNKLQLLVKGQDIGSYTPTMDYPAVKITQVHQADSPNYLFIDLEIGRLARPGTFTITFNRGRTDKLEWPYTLKTRNKGSSALKGFDASDVIYLITPDRFANGNPDNDIVEGTRQMEMDRSKTYSRHGGDIQGIIDHLPYLKEMGFTAIWPSPLLENDMPEWSYHGYAITDYYKVDPRFGTNEDYIRLADEARKLGIKIIFDGVANHCGSSHWWMTDLPFNDWINFQQADSVVVTNHRRTVNLDPYAAEADRAVMTGGWFVPTMPDLNQRNPFMAEYLIQNNIWWIEVLGLGGIRQDTYPYPYKDFLTDWTCRIMTEYPDFNIVGEEWTGNPLIASYWQAGKHRKDGYESCLKSVMDFHTQEELAKALTTDDAEWDGGLMKLYKALANDHAYADPNNLLVFGDNHDMDRIATKLNRDPELIRMALAYLSTIRGIPQFYYGTEVLMHNDDAPGDHGTIRSDFPGGWEGDAVNARTKEGLSQEQINTQRYLKSLLNWRQNEPLIHTGSLKHFVPKDGTYVYFRYDDNKVIMVALNKNDKPMTLDSSRFAEVIGGKRSGKNVLSGKPMNIEKTITLPAKQALILEIR
jgi:glycosidase